jgi:predicted homoserine dehydrogenase-like protein
MVGDWRPPAGFGDRPVSIGVIGTGFVASHFILELTRRPAWQLSRVLSRRAPAACMGFPTCERLTDSIDELITHSEVIVECTGDVLWATQTVGYALAAGRPVVTLNPEFHVTTGSYFVGQGLLTEAEGDQPGCQAALWEEATAMGFTPLVLGNMKGFLNRHPSLEDMRFWAAKQGISLLMVTSFTDGTKLQFEQALVGNYFGADIAQEELLGPETDDLAEASRILGEAARKLGTPITDYVLSRKLPHGVLLVARHQEEQRAALRYLKLGEGPYYTLIKNNIFVHLELFKTLERVVRQGHVLLDNTANPRLSVAAVAKQPLASGTRIARGCGSFELRGICVRIDDRPDHLPIGLAEQMVLRRKVEPGQILSLEDVDLPPSRAVDAWCAILDRRRMGRLGMRCPTA